MKPNRNDIPFDDSVLSSFEESAVVAVSKAGEFALSRFLGPMDIQAKFGKPGRDLVTDVDRESQRIIAGIMAEKHPDHQLLGEEDQKQDVDPAKDVVWCVDPIDGTANYVNGSLIHAVSVGILYRGAPIAGAVWTPWSPSESGGAVIHARRGGGTKWLGNDTKVITPSDEQGRPVSGHLSVLPGNARYVFNFGSALRGHLGDVRITGSASHEMANVATGMYQFGIMGAASVWDFAAASIIVEEAGGTVLVLDHSNASWVPFNGWALPYKNDENTYKRMRDWRGVMMAAHPHTADFLSQHLKPRQPNRFIKMLNDRLRRKKPVKTITASHKPNQTSHHIKPSTAIPAEAESTGRAPPPSLRT